jgi:endonuclease/exonuclease/phosphatase family metal-dependent hydrolase
MALAVLFWNVRKNDGCLPSLVRLARSEQIDVLLLAEPLPDLDGLLRGLNQIGQGVYHEASAGEDVKVTFVTRLRTDQVSLCYDDDRRDEAVWKVAGSNLPFILLAAAHLPAKTGGVTDTDQQMWARWLADKLSDAEDAQKSRATVLVGDLNMNPSDPGVASATGLQGLMTRDLARKDDRRHHGISFRRFYNPMWGLFGDRTAGPPGTYYWDASVPSNPHWHILDQVLLRPELIDALLELRIVDHDGAESLLEKGVPRKNDRSDHLPLLFRLDT